MVYQAGNNANPDWSMNDWADHWRYEIGVNIIPANTRKKMPSVDTWEPWQTEPIPEWLHKQWKAENAFDKGMAIIAGRIWHAKDSSKNDLYLILVDLDNKKAIDEFCTRNGVMTPLAELAKTLIVEQHDDQPDKAHVIFYANHAFPKKSSDKTNSKLTDKINKNEIPAIEIKGDGKHGIFFVTPSTHENGHKYRIIGTRTLETQVDALETHLDNICNKYGIPYLTHDGNGNAGNKIPISELFKEDTRIYEGHNRHEAILRIMESLLRRNQNILTHEQIKSLAREWNQKHCIPPLSDSEFESQWKDAVAFIKRTNAQRDSGQNAKYPELVGNIYYQINEKPDRYIVAYTQKHTVIEATVKTKIRQDKDTHQESIDKSLVHNKTYFGCIPVKITRHKNPLTFLETTTKFSMTFVDGFGETNKFKHKSLVEIVQGLKDLGYVLSDGAEMALAAMVQAYKENKLIEDNEDIEYSGFFTDKDNKIIASNLEVRMPTAQQVSDAVTVLDELKPYYEKRLDLLATSIVWGVVAPLMFMLKQNNYYLRLLQFYGSPNATKSNTGKIILALDGHQEDHKFTLNLSRFDTLARVGQALGHSTFPILVDEMNLNDPRMHWLIELLKSIVENQISRSKFPRSGASNTIDIPALCLPILTGNPPPPLDESAYMKRVIDRYFPQSETIGEKDPKAGQFKEYLRINLPRLKALGDFRNWYIMNHQDEILDEKRAVPLDLGLNILKAAFEYAGIEIPTWLVNDRLPENQLEESMEDNDVIVKSAFEKYINEQVGKAMPIWRQKNNEFMLPPDITDRLTDLAHDKLLPYVKYSARKFGIMITSGILNELYNHGVTGKQLPNLRALADYMNAEYTKSDGKKVVFADKHKLTKYFDEQNE